MQQRENHPVHPKVAFVVEKWCERAAHGNRIIIRQFYLDANCETGLEPEQIIALLPLVVNVLIERWLVDLNTTLRRPYCT